MIKPWLEWGNQLSAYDRYSLFWTTFGGGGKTQQFFEMTSDYFNELFKLVKNETNYKNKNNTNMRDATSCLFM